MANCHQKKFFLDTKILIYHVHLYLFMPIIEAFAFGSHHQFKTHVKIFILIIQGDHLERWESRGLLCNWKMHFRSCLRALIDQKYGTFDYPHQGSSVFHFKIQ